MGLSEWIGVIGIISTVIGIIVGIIGWRSLNKANNLTAQNIGHSQVNQGENITIINNGANTYSIMKIARDITNEELSDVIKMMNSMKEEVHAVRGEISSMPRFHVGTTPPPNAKEGDIWFHTYENDN